MWQRRCHIMCYIIISCAPCGRGAAISGCEATGEHKPTGNTRGKRGYEEGMKGPGVNGAELAPIAAAPSSGPLASSHNDAAHSKREHMHLTAGSTEELDSVCGRDGPGCLTRDISLSGARLGDNVAILVQLHLYKMHHERHMGSRSGGLQVRKSFALHWDFMLSRAPLAGFIVMMVMYGWPCGNSFLPKTRARACTKKKRFYRQPTHAPWQISLLWPLRVVPRLF